jgi:hypothetical protein
MVRGRLRSFVNVALPLGLGSQMLVRVAVLGACLLGAGSAVAQELGPEEARAFVVGKLFAYTCFDGTAGVGRIFSDGSVVGTIKPRGRGEMRFAALPAGTIHIAGSSMCARLAGMPIEPCFRVQKIDYKSFRGSISGMGFAYCDFSQRNPRNQLTSGVRMAPAAATSAAVTTPVATTPVVTTPVSASPLPAPPASPPAAAAPAPTPVAAGSMPED